MLEGSCLCGLVAFEAGELTGPVGHCHCTSCRKAHSAAFATTSRVLREGFRWTMGEHLVRHFESSPGKRRHFCSNCGTHLMAEWHGQDSVILRLGCLDTDPGQRPVGHIWVSDSVPWLEYGPELPHLPQGASVAPKDPSQ